MISEKLQMLMIFVQHLQLSDRLVNVKRLLHKYGLPPLPHISRTWYACSTGHWHGPTSGCRII